MSEDKIYRIHGAILNKINMGYLKHNFLQPNKLLSDYTILVKL